MNLLYKPQTRFLDIKPKPMQLQTTRLVKQKPKLVHVVSFLAVMSGKWKYHRPSRLAGDVHVN